MPNKIGRDVLKQFLPNHQTIVAFEELLKFVQETGPDALEQALALINSIRRVNTGDINARLAELEAPTARRGSGQPGLEGRVANVEAQPAARTNLSGILARLDALEAAERRQVNLSEILRRIETIESFIGV